MQTLIKTLDADKGEVFTVAGGRRILLVKCRPRIEIYEHSQNINAMGAQGYNIKTHQSIAVFCIRPKPTRNIDAEFLRTVSRFEFTGDFQRQDGIFERLRFDSLSVNELDLFGDWIF